MSSARYLFGTDEQRVQRLGGSSVKVEGVCWLRKEFGSEGEALKHACRMVDEFKREGREEFVLVAQDPAATKWFSAPVIPLEDDSGVEFVPKEIVVEAARQADKRHRH